MAKQTQLKTFYNIESSLTIVKFSIQKNVKFERQRR